MDNKKNKAASLPHGIVADIDLLLAKRKIRAKTLTKKTGISEQSLSILKNGKAQGIRFSTLDKLCRELNCQPGDILRYDGTITKNGKYE